jgi:hypothetical protein
MLAESRLSKSKATKTTVDQEKKEILTDQTASLLIEKEGLTGYQVHFIRHNGQMQIKN